MRYYKIDISNTDPVTGKVTQILGADKKPFGPYSSHNALGVVNPGALGVEFDIPVSTFDLATGGAFLRIWGVGLGVMGQSSNFNGANITIEGGMAKGLPLANPKQKGLLLKSVVQQAFGNWQGVNQSLDFQIIGIYGSMAAPKNIIFDCQDGQSFIEAVLLALRNAFPKARVVFDTATTQDGLILPYDPQTGHYENIAQFAQYVNATSRAIVNQDGYQGIKIAPTEDGFRVSDGAITDTSSTGRETGPTQIAFNDLIGQPTWLSTGAISFKTVMRSDIALQSRIQMPAGPTITTADSQSRYRNSLTFGGTFIVQSIRHIGYSKERSADSWVTIFEATTDNANP